MSFTRFLLVMLMCMAPVLAMKTGVGRYDITGPASRVSGLILDQEKRHRTTHGVHLRLFARAFVMEGDNGRRMIFVSADLCTIFQSIKIGVIERLESLYGDLYSHENVVLSAIHTHSGPGGSSWYSVYNLFGLGFSKSSYEVAVDGITKAIQMAHNSLKESTLKLNKGELFFTNANRSPISYLQNPQEERDKYADVGNTDKTMTVLRMDTKEGPQGVISWYPVHGVNMPNTNTLISSDNKGWASLLLEREFAPTSPMGESPYVAAVAQENEGDSTPNIMGAHCLDGEDCDFYHSTCEGHGGHKSSYCRGTGPGGEDYFESTYKIGENQAYRTLELMEDGDLLEGDVEYRHIWVDFTNITTPSGRTCIPAAGDAFAAGTTDGPGAFDFIQGSNSTKDNPYWNFLANFIAKPTKDQIECHYPKPILLNLDSSLISHNPWLPEILPLQLVRVGKLVIIAVPTELTTMSGRRLKESVRSSFAPYVNVEEMEFVIAGLSNTYIQYTATYEEYQIQRYEGASTLFGPHQLEAFQQEFSKLAKAMATNMTVPAGPTPPNLLDHQMNFKPPHVLDVHPLGKPFGTVEVDAAPQYLAGDVVSVEFWGADLSNDCKIGSSFLTIEQQVEDGKWNVYLTDSDWDTQLHWKRKGVDESLVTVRWQTRAVERKGVFVTPAGVYRVCHSGVSKSLEGAKGFKGCSRSFEVTHGAARLRG